MLETTEKIIRKLYQEAENNYYSTNKDFYEDRLTARNDVILYEIALEEIKSAKLNDEIDDCVF